MFVQLGAKFFSSIGKISAPREENSQTQQVSRKFAALTAKIEKTREKQFLLSFAPELQNGSRKNLSVSQRIDPLAVFRLLQTSIDAHVVRKAELNLRDDNFELEGKY